MKINELYKLINSRLKKISSEADSETTLILYKLFNKAKLEFLMNKEIEPDAGELKFLENILIQREKRIPLQYIFEEQKFRSYNFYVDSRVLIPRPETELLVEKVIELANNYPSSLVKIVDVGCGSGAIAISLALEIDRAEVYAVDISEDALKVAEINKKKYNLTEPKLKLIKGDKLEIFRTEKFKFDFLVSNPPYIPKEQYLQLEDEVLIHEPEMALLGLDNDGLGFYRYFAREAKNFVNSGGYLCFEIGYGQANSITDILKAENIFDTIEIIKDYNNIERIVVARLNYENITS